MATSVSDAATPGHPEGWPSSGVVRKRRIGRYELVNRLGVGGIAEVYLARARGLEGFEKLVALKLIRPSLANDGEFIRSFLEEARLSASLQHPAIAQVFEVGQAGGEYFFAMEYVEGRTLRDL